MEGVTGKCRVSPLLLGVVSVFVEGIFVEDVLVGDVFVEDVFVGDEVLVVMTRSFSELELICLFGELDNNGSSEVLETKDLFSGELATAGRFSKVVLGCLSGDCSRS